MISIAISQPTYLPWLGYFNQIAKSDVFVFLDNVQVERRSWQTRNRIKDVQDQEIWLSVPVSAARHDLISNAHVLYNNPLWVNKHLKSIYQHLAKTPYLNDVMDLLNDGLKIEYSTLSELNISLIKLVSAALGLKTNFFQASSLNVEGAKDDLLLAIIKNFKASKYHANNGSASYLELARKKFHDNDVSIEYQQWTHPTYQQKGSEFIPYLSWVDPVSYLGFDHVSRLISQSGDNYV
jgi:hypothetical protein